MNLGKFLDHLESDAFVFIGSYSSFFFIGTKSLFLERIEAINRSIRFELERMERMPGDSTETRRLRVQQRKLDKSRSLLDRHVIDYYERPIKKDGLCIIVEGTEVGRFWEPDEFKIKR